MEDPLFTLIPNGHLEDSILCIAWKEKPRDSMSSDKQFSNRKSKRKYLRVKSLKCNKCCIYDY